MFFLALGQMYISPPIETNMDSRVHVDYNRILEKTGVPMKSDMNSSPYM